MPRFRAIFLFRALIAAILCATAGKSQDPQAALTGTVRDGSGQPVGNAMVQVEQQQTLLRRTTHTSAAGVYSIVGLPIGTYALEVTQTGFHAASARNIQLLVGQVRDLDATLQLAGSQSQIDVNASASEIDQSSSSIGARLVRRQIDELPVNGRNWATLLPLIPGATDPGTSDQRSVRFAGHGRDDNNVTLDGVDATGISNQPQKSGIRLAIPTSTIAEFKVDSTLYPTESADGTGGQVMLASAGGSNTIRTELFNYLRNDVFDARNPFAAGKQPFRLNQFGASVGGPVFRNRTFFFVAFEGLRQRLDQAVQGFTPSRAYRSRLLNQSPALGPLINAFPVGNLGQPGSPNIDIFSGLSAQKIAETSGMIRIDHRFSSKINAFVRVNIDEAMSDVPLNNLRDRTTVDNRPMNGIVSVSQVLSPFLLNEIKIGFNQIFSRTNNQTPLSFGLQVPGFSTVSSAQQKQEDDTSASVLDNFAASLARHTLKMGVEGRRVFTNPGSSATGTVAFADPDAFLSNQVNSASVTASLPLKRLRKTQAFGFIQDEYKASQTLTFNLGLRYQFFNVFRETQGRAVPFDLAGCGGFCAPGAQFSNPRTNDLDPRIAVAWAPSRSGGRTVVRAGFGIYHGDGQLEDQNLPASNDQARFSLTSSQIPSLAYPITPYLANASGILSPRAQNRNRKDEYSSQWSLTVQQELPLHITGSVSYTGNKGTDLQTITYTNILNPASGTRPFPQFGQLEYRTNDSNSNFHALILSAQRHLRSGWILGTNYMWSHAINDGSLGGGEADIISPQNPFCRICERASSAQDIRHFFTANSVYELPFGHGKRYLAQPGLRRAMLGNWSLTGIGTARSGLPVNVTLSRAASVAPYGYTVNQRPNLVAGVSLVPQGGSSPARWMNPRAFAVPAANTFGNAGRDVARGPVLYQLDVGLAKRFPISERAALQFRWEVFNVFNRTQLGQPSGDFTVSNQLGVIQSTINTGAIGSGTPRQMQFMLRASF